MRHCESVPPGSALRLGRRRLRRPRDGAHRDRDADGSGDGPGNDLRRVGEQERDGNGRECRQAQQHHRARSRGGGDRCAGGERRPPGSQAPTPAATIAGLPGRGRPARPKSAWIERLVSITGAGEGPASCGPTRYRPRQEDSNRFVLETNLKIFVNLELRDSRAPRSRRSRRSPPAARGMAARSRARSPAGRGPGISPAVRSAGPRATRAMPAARTRSG